MYIPIYTTLKGQVRMSCYGEEIRGMLLIVSTSLVVKQWSIISFFQHLKISSIKIPTEELPCPYRTGDVLGLIYGWQPIISITPNFDPFTIIYSPKCTFGN